MNWKPPTAEALVLVDTSAWVEFFRRNGELLVKLAVKSLLDEYEAGLCGPVEMEFLGGARAHERKEIQEAFDIVPYVANNQKIWREAGLNYAALRAQGLTAPWNDILIATIAMKTGLRVYAKDKHFDAMAERMPELKLYSPGYNGMFEPE